MKPLLKLLAAVAVAFYAGAGALLHAQTGTNQIWFGKQGELPDFANALTTLDMTALTANSDGSVNFMLDILHDDDVDGLQDVVFEVHYDSSKIEVVGAMNILPAKFSVPLAARHFAGATYAEFEAFSLNAPIDDNDPATDSLLYLAWVHNDATLLAGKTRLLTLEFKWKAGVSGNAALNVVGDPNQLPFLAQSLNAANLTLLGPPRP